MEAWVKYLLKQVAKKGTLYKNLSEQSQILFDNVHLEIWGPNFNCNEQNYHLITSASNRLNHLNRKSLQYMKASKSIYEFIEIYNSIEDDIDDILVSLEELLYFDSENELCPPDGSLRDCPF